MHLELLFFRFISPRYSLCATNTLEQGKHRTIAEMASATEPIKFESTVPKIRSVSRVRTVRGTSCRWPRDRCIFTSGTDARVPRTRMGIVRRAYAAPARRVHLIAIGHTSRSCVHLTCAKNRDHGDSLPTS